LILSALTSIEDVFVVLKLERMVCQILIILFFIRGWQYNLIIQK